MSISKINPTDKQLKFFGLKLSFFILVFTQIILPFQFTVKVPPSTILPLLTLGLMAFISPKAMTLLYYPVKGIERILKKLISFVVLTLVFYLVITPIALLKRITHQDGLDKTFQVEKESYYQDFKENDMIKNMKMPF